MPSPSQEPPPQLFREVPSYDQFLIAEELESLLCELSETRRLYIRVCELTNPFRIYNTPGPIYTICSDDLDS